MIIQALFFENFVHQKMDVGQIKGSHFYLSIFYPYYFVY